ncbi:MAG: AbrB/MazE/SpoVT family DNA-binding domain-containing protein [Patescibacteria group bacterium]
MKVGAITKPNSKGQIVIPKEIRDALNINERVYLNLSIRGDGVYMHPIKEIISGEESENSLLDILEKTRGAWAGDSWPKTEKRRRKIELEASRRRKKAW